ncbi:emp24/gp25L/p24 family protein [Ascoidea rubescens DSM 1968]|uniref:Endosomal cargo receptor Erp3 n=1 Tax=Ascoidea rubescens DSM 1968 TaxID=1344418 RepID=A0A1D2VCB5_9ASCO|nr:endosomal cargo receptor Erp3 [Ascoidea rubescens DSM 1968]ODV59265.1 endosomal cargo receptor Erp3 [Ascoidea rubescens DSM 1968]
MIQIKIIAVLVLALFFVVFSDASALTFVLGAQEKSCYYVLTEEPEVYVGYYFAVQSGGSFDVDYTIMGPDGKVVISKEKQRQGDWIFKADLPGEYEFCFANEMSTFAEKVVDFEIKLENDFKAHLPESPNQPASVEGMVSSVENIDSKLNNLIRTLQYYKTRNNRNQSTVRSTESRIFWFSILEVLLMCGMAGLQVAVVHLFFNGSRKQLV